MSKNPAPGSTIRISYRSSRHILEVFALNHYLRAFIGGHPDGTREMEAMIQKIALDCATALGVAVVVRADLGYGTNVYTSQALD